MNDQTGSVENSESAEGAPELADARALGAAAGNREVVLDRAPAAAVRDEMEAGLLDALGAAGSGVIGGAQREHVKLLADAYADRYESGEIDELTLLSEFVADLIISGVTKEPLTLDSLGRLWRGARHKRAAERHRMLRTAARIALWFGAKYAPSVPISTGWQFVEEAIEDAEQVANPDSSDARRAIADAIATQLTANSLEAELQAAPEPERECDLLNAVYFSRASDVDDAACGTPTDESSGHAACIELHVEAGVLDDRPALSGADDLTCGTPSDECSICDATRMDRSFWVDVLDDLHRAARRLALTSLAFMVTPLGILDEAIKLTVSNEDVARRLLRLYADHPAAVINYFMSDDWAYLQLRLAALLESDARNSAAPIS